MPTITIDNREVEVPRGATILDAAQKLGIDVPTLCFLKGCRPSTSCLVCTIKIRGRDQLVPSCATHAVDDMEIDSETEEVHQVRRAALELLLSDHVGDCMAPCWFACPAHMDIPRMLRQIARDELRDAIVTIKRDIALPAILGRVCPKPCEKGCRRGVADDPVTICELKRFVADVDLASDDPHKPECKRASGRRVAVVGAGPTGLAAAYHLLQEGHATTIFDHAEQPGGRLRYEMSEEELPRDVLDAEIGQILRLGPELCMNVPASEGAWLGDLQGEFDAVLIACGPVQKKTAEGWGLTVGRRGIETSAATYETSTSGVFAAGRAVRGKCMVIRSVADGKEAAAAISQYVSGVPITPVKKPFSSRIGRVTAEEAATFLVGAQPGPREEPSGGIAAGYGLKQAVLQAGRCMHCDCRARGSCKLEKYAAIYDASASRYQSRRRPFEINAQHSTVIYEPGKCIRCELCVQIASEATDSLGLTFVGRGFDVKVGIPFDGSLEDALGEVAARCVRACPTAALAFADDIVTCEL